MYLLIALVLNNICNVIYNLRYNNKNIIIQVYDNISN